MIKIKQKTKGDLKIKNKNKQLATKSYLPKIGSIDVNKVIETIVSDFKEGVDYAVISKGMKPTLLVPGAGKVNFRFNLMPIFKKDEEILSMVSHIKGAIPLICELIDRRTGKKIGEGRGASVFGNGKNCETLNGAIKMAEIRAERDAVLRTFALRDRFTQDMDETEKNGKIPTVASFTVSDSGEIKSEEKVL